MLKFKDDYTTLTATFEDFILLVYTVIDDLYQRSVPVCVSQRRNVHTAKMSDSEIITLSICGELIGIDSEKAWYSFVKRNYRHLFPHLCCRTRFNRTRRALLQVTELLRQKLAQSFPIPDSRYFVIDSFPLPVCKFGHAALLPFLPRGWRKLWKMSIQKGNLFRVQSTCPYYHRRLCNCF